MKRSKGLALTVSALALSALLLAGCGKQAADPTPTAPVTQETQSSAILGVADMVGKTDEEVKDLFGGGTENKSEDGAALLGRSYTAVLDGMDAVIETVYTEELSVSAASVRLEGADAGEVESALTRSCGAPEKVEQQDGAEAQYLRWTKDGVSVALYDSYGMVSVEFTAANG